MNFHINNNFYENKKKDLTILQVCENNNVVIPRFCYHEKLSIAGNCRMCLIEVEKAPKPIASCALPISDNIKIFTETLLVKKAREGILEFLLINHPLDCPICDWGGECDLQDQTQVFGGDRGRYYEEKRSVSDKNCGPLIKTYMTRCIHCTRCVRFYTEIAGMSVFGTTGRGAKMEISAYTPEIFNSEITGNLIDLCPVGALTSKPSAFSARPWDYDSFKSLDPFDGFGSSIQIDLHGLEIIRILPIINEFVNEEWINDKCRFSFDALKLQRLTQPYIKINNKLIASSWKNTFLFIKKNLKNCESLLGIFGPLVDFETLLGLKYLFANLGLKSNIQFQNTFNISNLDFCHNLFFNFNNIKNIEYDTALFLGLDLKKESPVLNSKFRRYALNKNLLIGSIGSNNFTNFNILKLGNNYNILLDILKGRNWFSFYILKSKKVLFLIGLNFFTNLNSSYNWSKLLEYKINLKKIYNIDLDLFFVSPFLSINNAFELGLNNSKNLLNNKTLIYLLSVTSIKNFNNFFNTNNFLIYQGHHGNDLALKSNIILPTSNFLEKNGHFLTLQGFFERTNQILMPLGLARSDSDIFKALSLQLSLNNLTKLNFETLHNYKYILNLNSKIPYFKTNILIFNSLFNKNTFNISIEPIIYNYWMTDPISLNSLTMSLTSKFLEPLHNFEK